MLQYFSNVVGEFKQIRWLSTKKALALTIITIITAFAAGFTLGAIDSMFAVLLRSVVI